VSSEKSTTEAKLVTLICRGALKTVAAGDFDHHVYAEQPPFVFTHLV
jgi:hypothetical protein